MSRNKKRREKIAGLEEEIELHREKIRSELDKPRPNWPRIAHWAKECAGWQLQVDRNRAKLP